MSCLFFLALNFIAAHVWWFVGAIVFLTVIGAACSAGSDYDDEHGFDDLHGDYPRVPPEYTGKRDAA